MEDPHGGRRRGMITTLLETLTSCLPSVSRAQWVCLYGLWSGRLSWFKWQMCSKRRVVQISHHPFMRLPGRHASVPDLDQNWVRGLHTVVPMWYRLILFDSKSATGYIQGCCKPEETHINDLDVLGLKTRTTNQECPKWSSSS